MEDKKFIRATGRGLTSERIVNVGKAFHSYTELPGKCPSIRLLEKHKFSRKKTSNFYLE